MHSLKDSEKVATMIKILLRTAILDQCINVFYDTLTDNFIKPRLKFISNQKIFERLGQLMALPLIRRRYPSTFADKIITVEARQFPDGIYSSHHKMKS
jgi:hypothetical protein